RFPNGSETARSILAQLVTGNECLVCGNTAPSAAASYAARIETQHCVVCDTDLSATDNAVLGTELADARVNSAATALDRLPGELSAAKDRARAAVRGGA